MKGSERAQVVPPQPEVATEEPGEDRTPEKARDPRRLSWSELLKRVFQIDLSTCPDCGGKLKFIAAILEPDVLGQILTHLKLPTQAPKFHPPRAPPQSALWDDYPA